MRNAMILLALTLAAAGPGCKKKDENPTTGSGMASGSAETGSAATGSGSAAATGSAAGSGSSTMAGSAGGSGSGTPTVATGSAGSGSDAAGTPMSHHAGMCPSTVFGATTKVALKDGKLTVTVTSDDKDAILAIQKRAELSLKEKTDGGAGSGHDQKGTHGGGMGLCPIHIPEGAKAESKNDAKGVVVTITPKDPKDADNLKSDIETRITKAADWVKANEKAGRGNQGGDGGGSGQDGMNHSGSGDGKGMERKKAGGK